MYKECQCGSHKFRVAITDDETYLICPDCGQKTKIKLLEFGDTMNYDPDLFSDHWGSNRAE